MGTTLIRRAGASAVCLALGAGLVSCTTTVPTVGGPNGSAANKPTAGEPQTPGNGLNQFANDQGKGGGKLTAAELDAMANENARLMESIRKDDPRKPANPSSVTSNPNSPSTPITTPNAPAATPSGDESPVGAGLNTLAPEGLKQTNETATPNAPAPTTKLDPDAKVSQAVDELARSLRDRAGSNKTPIRDYLALAWLDAVRPGSLGALDSGPAAQRVDPNQAKSIALARDFALALYGNPDALRDPDRVWASLQKAAEPILASRDLLIAAADLCSRVDGYGQYVPIPTRTFQAGVAHPLVVYTEVENFAHRSSTDPTTSGERFSVDLGVAVEVWQDADKPTLQKRWSEAGVSETSRRKRRDFFVTNVIELPKALSVGAYTLKIIVNDRVKGAVAEKVIPFTIVADATTGQPPK